MNKPALVDLIKNIASQLTKEAAGPRSARRGADAPVISTRAKDTSEDPTAPIDPPSDKPSIPSVSPPAPVKLDDPTKVSPTRINISSEHVSALNAVKEMQIAMQNLGQAVIEDYESATMAAKPKDTTQPLATAEVKSAKKSFNDFIAEQYLGGLDEDKKGVEWSKDVKVTTLPGKQKTQTDIYELDVVMDTLRRIGASSKEFKADGIWDFRTDNALRNMMGFAYALLQLEGDFGLENNMYTFAHWRDFYNSMSGYQIVNGKAEVTPKQKVFRARKITNHLKLITKLYNLFRQQVLARPEFRPTIEGKRPFERYDTRGSNKDFITPEEDQMSKSDVIKIPVTYIAPKLPNKKLNYIPLKALRNKEEYIKWMTEYAGNTEESALNIFNKIIKPKIESM